MPTDWRLLHGNHFEGARVLVTGGAGFIGSHLTDALVALGAHVVVLDDMSSGHMDNLEQVLPSGRMDMVDGSILDSTLVSKLAATCKYVFHLAALGSVPRSLRMPDLYTRINVLGTVSVLEAARAGRVEKLVFAASSSAYGDSPELPKRETMLPRPCSPYAATKVACENMIASYAAGYGLPAVSLRYFNIFGPRQNPHSAYAAVIAAFAKAVLNDQPPVIFGDGTQSRDFTYVDNAVHANLLAARAPNLRGPVINIAAGRSVTVTELATRIARILGRPQLTPQYEPARAGDVLHSQADLTLAKELLGYQAIVDLEQGLEQTLAWYRAALHTA